MMKPNISAPWYTHQKKLAAIFELDEEVEVGEVTESEGTYHIQITVKTQSKADALAALLKSKIDFGGAVLEIHVCCDANDGTRESLYKAAFAFNRRIADVRTMGDHTGTPHLFVIAEPDLIQFYNDDISDYRGNFNGLLSDVMKDVFVDGDGVHFNTIDLTENE